MQNAKNINRVRKAELNDSGAAQGDTNFEGDKLCHVTQNQSIRQQRR